MDDDRRNEERYPSFKLVDLVTLDPSGAEHSFPVMLRDRSRPGFGCVYVGQVPPPLERDYDINATEEESIPVRVQWIRKVADYVSILGLELRED
jgi:hypothetical protein